MRIGIPKCGCGGNDRFPHLSNYDLTVALCYNGDPNVFFDKTNTGKCPRHAKKLTPGGEELLRQISKILDEHKKFMQKDKEESGE